MYRILLYMVEQNTSNASTRHTFGFVMSFRNANNETFVWFGKLSQTKYSCKSFVFPATWDYIRVRMGQSRTSFTILLCKTFLKVQFSPARVATRLQFMIENIIWKYIAESLSLTQLLCTSDISNPTYILVFGLGVEVREKQFFLKS